MGPLSDSDVGPLLKSLGFEYVSGYGPTAIWRDKSDKKLSSQRTLADKAWGADSPYAEQKAPPTPNIANPYDPSVTPEQRIGLLERSGYKYLPGSGTGAAALWVDPMGNTSTEGNLLKQIINPAAQNNGDLSAQVDASGNYFVIRGGKGYLLDGTPYTPVGRDTSRMTAGESAQLGLGFARLGQDQAQFSQNFAEGQRQFDAKFDRGNFESDRSFNEARTQFATKVAEEARQFDASQEGMDRRAQLQESGAYDRALLSEGESNRRTALNAQTQGFNTVANLTPSLGRLALDNAEFVSKTYREPSDFLHASQLTRGVAPVNPMRTQADSINQLSSSIAGYNQALQGFNTAPVAGFGASTAPQARPVARPVSAPAAPAQAFTPYAGQIENPEGGNNWTGYAPPATTTREQANASLKAAGAPSWLPGFADGTGMTTEPMFRVGEEEDGSPNDTEEVIANPTGAPLGVISNDELNGNPADDMEAEQHQKKAAAIGKVMQFVDNPEVLHALVDEMDDHKKKSKPTGFSGGTGMPRYASGTGYGFDSSGYDPTKYGMGSQAALERDNLDRKNSGEFTAYSPLSGMWYNPSNPDPLTKSRMSGAGSTGGFSLPGIPQIPGVAQTTQAQLQADEAAARPPAITSILNGQRPNPLNLGFSLPTPGLLNTLTDREKEAFGTTLAVQYNLAPSDVESAIRQRFGGTGARSARF